MTTLFEDLSYCMSDVTLAEVLDDVEVLEDVEEDEEWEV